MEPADPTPAGFFGWCERPCRTAMAASFFGSTVMYVAASRNVRAFGRIAAVRILELSLPALVSHQANRSAPADVNLTNVPLS
jgi:hypothetical protein